MYCISKATKLPHPPSMLQSNYCPSASEVFVMMPTLSSLAVPVVVITTTTGATSDDEVWHHDNTQFFCGMHNWDRKLVLGLFFFYTRQITCIYGVTFSRKLHQGSLVPAGIAFPVTLDKHSLSFDVWLIGPGWWQPLCGSMGHGNMETIFPGGNSCYKFHSFIIIL